MDGHRYAGPDYHTCLWNSRGRPLTKIVGLEEIPNRADISTASLAAAFPFSEESDAEETFKSSRVDFQASRTPSPVTICIAY